MDGGGIDLDLDRSGDSDLVSVLYLTCRSVKDLLANLEDPWYRFGES
jgi:hypothetical protein